MFEWFKRYRYNDIKNCLEGLSKEEFESLALLELKRKGLSISKDVLSTANSIVVVETSHEGFCQRYHGGHQVIILKFPSECSLEQLTLEKEFNDRGLQLTESDSNQIRPESYLITNVIPNKLNRKLAEKYRVIIIDGFALAKLLGNNKYNINKGVNVVSIFRHFDGYGIKCKGSPINTLGIVRLDHFTSVIDAFKTAKNIQNDTKCSIEWDCERPAWAIEASEDTA